MDKLDTKPGKIQLIKDDYMFDKSKIGYSFPPFTIEVERGKFHELALAIGDSNPIYHSREAAHEAGYNDIPMPPTGPTLFSFWGYKQAGNNLASVGINVERILHGEEEFEYLSPVQPGDVLTGVMTIVEGRTRRSKAGTMDILTTETRYTNQHNQPVVNARTTVVVRE